MAPCWMVRGSWPSGCRASRTRIGPPCWRAVPSESRTAPPFGSLASGSRSSSGWCRLVGLLGPLGPWLGRAPRTGTCRRLLGLRLQWAGLPAPGPPGSPIVARPSESSPGVSELVRKLEKRTELPQQKFLAKLREYQEVPAEVWAEQFPIGYRTRVAAEFLSEVFGSGLTGEKWARRFVEERQASKSPACRELIPTMLAIDTLVLVDGDAGIINSVALERLCRKALGIVEAWRKVQNEGDWSRPGGSKGWKSKVDYEAARRVDPGLLDEAHFRIRPLEEEVRKEAGRDASLLKARLKLEKQQQDSGQ